MKQNKKADPLSEVKVGQIGEWVSRRKIGLSPFTRLVSRTLWRYRNKYLIPKKQNGAFLYHMAFLLFATSYILVEHPERSKYLFFLFIIRFCLFICFSF